jgi:hypothetical protein
MIAYQAKNCSYAQEMVLALGRAPQRVSGHPLARIFALSVANM